MALTRKGQSNNLLEEKLTKFNNEFNFDWNDSATFEQSKKLHPEVETFIASAKEIYQALSPVYQRAVGQLMHKLAAYSLHILRKNDDQILALLDTAYAVLLKNSVRESAEEIAGKYNELSWIRLHTAFLYQQRMPKATVTTEDELDAFNSLVESGLRYLIPAAFAEQQLTSNEDKKLKSYALAVEALIKYEAAKKVPVEFKGFESSNEACNATDIFEAISLYEKAIAVHESIENRDPNDLHYVRMLNRLAMMYVEVKLVSKAEVLFIKLEKCLKEIDRIPNPHTSRLCDGLGNFFLGRDNDQAIRYYQQGEKSQKAFDGETISDDVKKLTDKIDAIKQTQALSKLVNRDKIHADGRNQENNIARLRQILKDNKRNPFFPDSLRKDISRILSAYYTYYVREVNRAPKYSAIHLKLAARQDFDYLVAKVNAAFALTIKGSYFEFTPFFEAKKVIEEFRSKNVGFRRFLNELRPDLSPDAYLKKLTELDADADLIDVHSAFIDRYIALMHHRNAKLPAKPTNYEDLQPAADALELAAKEMEKALRVILKVITEQTIIFEKHPEYELDLAESNHILHVIRGKQATIAASKVDVFKKLHAASENIYERKSLDSKIEIELGKIQKFTKDSEDALIKARKHWKDFNESSGAPHPISHITEQAYGVLLTSKGKYEKAIKVLETVISLQEGADKGKTKHCLSLTFAAQCKHEFEKGNHAAADALYVQAKKSFSETIALKQALLDADPLKDDFILKQTKDASDSFEKEIGQKLNISSAATPTSPRALGVFGGSNTSPKTPKPSGLINPSSSPIHGRKL